MSSEKETKTKINTEENEKLKTQIDASIGIARSLINSWLPPPKPGEKLDDDEDDLTMRQYSIGRPDRLGLGAKFLSHNDAMRHNNNSNGMASKEELQLKNKILNQNRRAAMDREINTPTPIGKRFRPQDTNNDSDSDDEEESRSTTVGIKQSKNKNKKKGGNNNNTAQPATATTNTNTNTKTNSGEGAGVGKKKIGNQGDFLSMYLSERAGKKKNKK